MREPVLQWGDDILPMSQAPSSWLVDRANCAWEKGPLCDEHWDDDFRRRYAAILLRERGL